MSNQGMNCRICKNQMVKMDEVEFSMGWYKEMIDIEKRLIEKKIINVFLCRCCFHVQIPITDLEGGYDSYRGFDLERDRAILYHDKRRQIDLLASKVKTNRLFLDIGCGTGEALEIARETFKEIIGVEPSRIQTRVLEEKGIPYINDYFKKELLINRDQYCDAFFSSQVFEHLENPLEVLKEIFEVCNDEAMGFIIVPNGQKNWIEKDSSLFLAEHISYFSPLSLTYMAYQAGFIVDYCNIYDGNNIEILLRKPTFIASFYEKREEIIKILRKLPKDKTISAWGCGRRISSLLPLIEDNVNLFRLFDSDSAKTRKYVRGCKTIISKPSFNDVIQNDIILLFGTKYDDEISRDLVENFGFTGKFVVI